MRLIFPYKALHRHPPGLKRPLEKALLYLGSDADFYSPCVVGCSSYTLKGASFRMSCRCILHSAFCNHYSAFQRGRGRAGGRSRARPSPSGARITLVAAWPRWDLCGFPLLLQISIVVRTRAPVALHNGANCQVFSFEGAPAMSIEPQDRNLLRELAKQ